VTPGRVYVGCSGWAYPSWRPDFYPAKTPAKKLLEAYASRLNSVEVNYTFRSLPTPAVAAGWLASVAHAPGFRFSFKAPQRITHILRLRDAAGPLDAFVLSLKPVLDADRFGAILFQLPPQFKADATRLASFLGTFRERQPALRCAFEFRHESWFTAEIFSILRDHQAAVCVAESDELATPDEVTADFTCYRLRRSDYSAEQLAAVGALLAARAKTGDVYAYFKHEDEPHGPLRAAAVLGAAVLDGVRG
jgi:uncharacterized protein YecE (DUF72 family)